jgi:hypothetical protein
MAQSVPPDNAIRTGQVFAIDGGTVRVLVNGGVVQAGYLTSYVPRVNDTVALVRQDAGWLILGSLYGHAAPEPVNPFADEFHLLSLSNSWTHRVGFPGLQYRYAWSPDFVMIMGEIVPGTTTDNTLIATLPVDYRPASEIIILHRKAAGAFGILAIQSDGTIRCYDSVGTGVMQIPPMIFPRTMLVT